MLHAYKCYLNPKKKLPLGLMVSILLVGSFPLDHLSSPISASGIPILIHHYLN
nr:MAG TPA: hypothetical protein [Caudoviricetes sp.]